jgi:hypothetical protein
MRESLAPNPPDKHEEPTTTSRKAKSEFSPILLTILGAIATGVLAILNSYCQAKQAHDLEQEKLRSTLILEAIKSPDAEERKKTLKFYVEAGLLSDPGKKIENMKAASIPRNLESNSNRSIQRKELPCSDIEVISDCPDEGCGPNLDPELNKRKNIRFDDQEPVMRSISWMKELPNPTHFTADNMKRDELKQLGEGQKITVVAYALAVRRGAKESCNCQLSAEKDTDNHIVLVDPSLQNPTLAANEADSVTAEFTPRVRLDHPNLSRAKLQPLIDDQGGRLLTRVTGQLMFDSDNFLGRPLKRKNNWEIHPVLKMDYCPKGKTCRSDKDENWKNLED